MRQEEVVVARLRLTLGGANGAVPSADARVLKWEGLVLTVTHTGVGDWTMDLAEGGWAAQNLRIEHEIEGATFVHCQFVQTDANSKQFLLFDAAAMPTDAAMVLDVKFIAQPNPT